MIFKESNKKSGVNKLNKIKSVAFALLLISTFVLYYLCAYAEFVVPEPTQAFYVNDFANVLDYETERKIYAIGNELENKTTAQIVLVTIDSLNGEDPLLYSVELFRKWGIGQKDKNNGILILNAVEDRQIEIRTGYGLEGAVPDSVAYDIRTKHISPYLKQRDYNAGLFNGYAAIASRVAEEYGISLESLSGQDFQPHENFPSSEVRDSDSNNDIIIIIVLALIFLDAVFNRFRITFAILRILFWISFYGGRGGRGGGRWGGGGGFGGGGFGGGFGGGRSGGGGSTGGGGSGGKY